MSKLLRFYWLENKVNQLLESIGFQQTNYNRVLQPEVKVLQQDKSEDLFVNIVTVETEGGNYITTIVTKSGGYSVKDERKTESLEMAMLEHDIAVTRLIKKGLTKSDFKMEAPVKLTT